MASEKESPCQNYCANDPNFAIICSFFDRFAITCGITYPTFAELQEMIENIQDVPPELIDLHVKLLRKIRRSVATEKWERALIKFCHSYLCSEEGWELERCGYKKCKIPVRLKILKTLLDAQFDLNIKFKNDINKLTPEELRLEPLGKDKVGQAYWCQFDSAANVRVYKEDQDEETWALVAKDREGLVGLITQLSSGEELLELELINEDSNSQEVEKPIIDTGQVVEQSTSEENTVDSVASKNEILSKEEGSCTDDTSRNIVLKTDSSPKEVSEDVKCDIKLKNGNEEATEETSKCTNVSFNGSQEVCPPVNGSDSNKDEVDSDQIKDKASLPESKDITLNKADTTLLLETESVNENSAREHSNANSDNIIGEVKKVTEEIKQRSLFKANSAPLFKGKIGKSSGSKLDQIFSRKLEQSNVLTCNGKNDNDNDSQENKVQIKTLTDDDSCSQSSVPVTINEQESDSLSTEQQAKRKADELFDQPSKKQCLVEEPTSELEPEVGEEIEEPVMIIKGEGSGEECDTGNPGKDSEEDVGTQNMSNNTTSNNSEITLKNAPSNNSFTEDILVEKSLNNGLPSDSCDVNELLQIKGVDSSQNSLELSKNDESVCNIAEKIVGDNPKRCAEAIDCDKEEPEVEKSIEEQLSDLTGEGLSPKANTECQNNTDNAKENVIETNTKSPEKGIRRKSFDSTNDKDTESIPPEAKKTKVENDCNDIFGTDDSMPYPSNEIKIDNDKVSLKGGEDDLKLSKHLTENETLDNPKLSENNDLNNVIQNSSAKDKFINSQDDTNCKTVDDNKESLVKEINKLENGIVSNKVEDCSELSQENKTSVDDNKPGSKENGSMGDQVKNSRHLNESVTDNNIHETTSETEIKTTKNDMELENQLKSDHESPSHAVEETIDDSVGTLIASKSEESMSKTPKTEDLEQNVVPPDNLTTQPETNLIEDKDSVAEGDKNEAHNDTSQEDKDVTANKKKSPLKKSPKPRRKVFTPKSRKRTNKNKVTKTDNPENSSIPEDNSSQKPEIADGKGPDHQLEASKGEDNISENKETKAKQITGRKRRNSRKNTNTEKESEEDLASDKKTNTEVDDEEVGGKRRKVKGKRAPNKNLRKDIEDKRNVKSSSEEENHSDDNIDKATKKSLKESKNTSASKKNQPAKGAKTTKSNQGKTKPNVKSSPNSKKGDADRISKEDRNNDGDDDDDKSDESTKKKTKKSKSQGRNSRAYSGINLDIDLNDTSRSVRQSSRIAQIKIKEQADHKHGDEHHHNADKSGKKHRKKKDDNEEAIKGTPKKKKKMKKVSDDDVPEDEPLSERKKRRKKKRKHPVKAFNERDPWKSSSGSSSDAEEEEEDHFDDIVEEEEELPLTVKSDHEFSPESDLEADEEWRPVRRARTAQKVKDPAEVAEESCKDLDDFACEKCGKKDHPEWILLCDTCNHGWHASCLRPSLMLVPEGDWHCPPCQHATLVKKLQETLKIYDRDTKRRDNEELRRKRLAYVGISLDNVLPGNAQTPKASGSESSESSESRSESESEYSDEPVYQLRQRRSGTTSYRFNEYDELINSAIRDEVEGSGAVIPALDVTHDVAQPKEEEPKPLINETGAEVPAEENQANAITDVKEKVGKPKKKREDSDEESSEEDDDSKNEDEDDDFPRVVPKRSTLPQPGRKKHRKLNSLDDPSDDDDDDEDFKGSSSEEEEEEDDYEESDESGGGRRKSRRGNHEPVRRSSRARKSRFDKEFINDDSEESDAPSRKKTKKLWSESGSESDDSTWGRKKKKKGYSSSRGRKFRKSKKFTIEDELSDIESSKTPKKKRQRKIKYGGLDDLDVEELPSRRTRGKKINYQEVIGTDSDEDIQKSKSFKKAVIEDDEEFDAEIEKQEASGEEYDSENEEKSSEEDEDGSEEEGKEVKSKNKNIHNKENVNHPKNDEKEEVKTVSEKVIVPSNNVPPPKVTPPKTTPPKAANKDKPPARRGRPPKAMIAPPPERLISEDEQYKAVVSKVATIGHSRGDISGAKAVNVSDYPQKFSETKDFMEPPQPITPVKIPNSSFDPKLVKRSPPIKIRSGVPVNTGVKSPTLGSPTSDVPQFSVKSPNSGPLHSPPDGSQFQMQRNLLPQNPTTARKSINVPLTNVKMENSVDEDDLEDEDLMEEIEEDDEEDDEDDSEDDVLEEGEIPKKVARRMARMEERMEKRKLAKHMEKLKSVQAGSVVSPGDVQPAMEQKHNPTTQPSQPLLRVVSPLKLMANPPGPLQSTFMNPSLGPRMPVGSPPSARMPIAMRPPQPANIPPGGEAALRRGRGRGKKAEKEEIMVAPGGSVIRGMLQQQSQSYPPSHYQQQYPPRIPYNPQQRMPRPPFHPGHPHPMDPSPSGGGPINVKQEPGANPVSSPVHIPNKPPSSAPPQPYHPQHRFDARPPGYPPRPPYGSYPPPPVSGSGYGHYGSYPPPPHPARDEYVAPSQPQPQPQPQPQYNEQFSEQPAPPPTSKPYNEEEGSGEFGGLVSYFSSQREEDIDT